MGKSKNDRYKSQDRNVGIRNLVAADMGNRFKSKRFDNNGGARREKDSKNSWENDEWDDWD
jgi:hypothetical protein